MMVVLLINLKLGLVAKSLTQRERINYFNIYSYVSRMAIIHVLIALPGIHHKLEVSQMAAIKTALLNGNLE